LGEYRSVGQAILKGAELFRELAAVVDPFAIRLCVLVHELLFFHLATYGQEPGKQCGGHS
jgi:hypothetical protein